MKKLYIFFWLVILSTCALAQDGVIKGKITNKVNNEPVPFASIVIQGTTTGTTSDENGVYEIKNLQPGQYNLEASFVGFQKLVVYEIQVTNARTAFVDFAMSEESKTLDEVVVSASNTFTKSDDSPLSLRTIGPTEIKQTPGGNRDISKVVRSLPGVASTPSFRNDIIIRGGAPSENTFYLDGIQIPVINHFQTQGSSGGPVGIINVDLLKEVSFYSGAFPANRGNTMSSVFDFQLKDGRTDKWTMNGVVGASDLGITFDGPISSKSSLVFSVRRSYLKFLFSIFNLPFLPVYNDVQFKYKYKLNDKNQITVLGIGAIDDFTLNFDAPSKSKTEADREEAEYILNILPVSTQWNYTIGAKYDHFRKHGTTSVVLSRNALNNNSIKYQNNDSSDPNNLVQNYNSRETENKFRVEDFYTKQNFKINYGISLEQAQYDTDDFSKIVTQGGLTIRDFSSLLKLTKWGFFGQVSNTFNQRLTLSFGLRGDANNYSSEMNNVFDQLSPRLSASYAITSTINANFNTGIYYQLPAYTVLGYRNSQTNALENKSNGVKYIRSKHLVSGLEFNLPRNSRITVEGFYKLYDQYPFLLEDSISLANLGADFGIIGNAPVNSTSKGRSYGLEFLFQQKLYNGFYGLVAYTFVRSEFQDKTGKYAPSSWDNRHLVSLTGGKKFAKNWEVGVRWLFTGGSPYTPFNVSETVRRQNWDVRPYGLPDYNQLNTQRISAFHQLDIRIDKKYFFKKWSLDVYLDVQNAYNYTTKFQDAIDVQKDANGAPLIDPSDSNFYLPKYIQSTSGQLLPTIGVIFEL
ncbi:MAG TPA: TonB-dependent receptor [Chryseolinea sp.]|nr:TonB-dependent receptor [Chryseolinea sp.]HPM30874.1 TonB-dependent receptor [Chryseolinea sp.]